MALSAVSLSGLCGESALAQSTDWWQDAVFYEVFVRSFADSTEGPLAGDGVGDLRGLIERLDTLNDGDPTTTTDLGVTALWLMPICQSPSYHGYDVVDYRAIDEEYGTTQDFLDLIEAAHARGMRVIVDTVINHSSSQHPWFLDALDADSPMHDWFVWSEQPREVAWDSTVWHAQRPEGPIENGLFYYGLFWSGMPDLNLRNADTTAAVHDFSRFWLTDMQADGFRLDAVKYLIEDWPQIEHTDETIAWLAEYRRAMKDANPEAFLIGEVWADSTQVARYIPDALDAAFEFDLAFAIVEGVRDGDAGRIARTIEAVQETYPPGRYATFLANHDMPRVMTTLREGSAREGSAREGSADEAEALTKAKLCATIQLTLPGIPFVYYGEEIGMTGAKPDPDLRTPMQWTEDAATAGFTTGTPWREPHTDTATVNVRAQTDDPASLLATYRRLIRLRQEHPDLWRGSFEVLETSDPAVLAYMLESPSKRLVVLVNCSDTAVVGVRLGRSETESGEGGEPLPWASLPAWGSAIITTPR
ncbi:Trehalose synthase [hydrothermal vent metagenome]|uniref:Trehalose synthase n=1 Tax=hydrothermal vent metagenome TaxID=652676 RepID=A0A3B1DBR0_9ZZZZ